MTLLGLDIGGTKTAAVVGEANGRPLGQATVQTNVSSPETVVQSALDATALALADAQLNRGDLAAAAAGVPGQVDPATGTVRLAVNLNFHTPYPLGHALQKALGVPVVLENDVRAATVGAYQWLNATEPVHSLAYLSIGTGIAAGIMIDGKLYRGVHGMAGEIGHIPVDPAGPRCACGAYGCLEAVAAGPAIATYANEVLGDDHSAGQLSTSEVLALAAAGSTGARHVIDRASYFLSRAIYLLVMTYDVERVVLGGGVTQAGAAFRLPLEKALDALRGDSALVEAMLPADKVVFLPTDFNAGAHGALQLAHNAQVTPTAQHI